MYKGKNHFLNFIGGHVGGGGGQTMQQHIWKNIQNRCIPHTKRQDLKN